MLSGMHKRLKAWASGMRVDMGPHRRLGRLLVFVVRRGGAAVSKRVQRRRPQSEMSWRGRGGWAAAGRPWVCIRPAGAQWQIRLCPCLKCQLCTAMRGKTGQAALAPSEECTALQEHAAVSVHAEICVLQLLSHKGWQRSPSGPGAAIGCFKIQIESKAAPSIPQSVSTALLVGSVVPLQRLDPR